MGNTIVAVVRVYRCQTSGPSLMSVNAIKEDLEKCLVIRETVPLTVHLLWHQLLFSHVCQHTHAVDRLVCCIEVGFHH
jgi:hypothetical protein